MIEFVTPQKILENGRIKTQINSTGLETRREWALGFGEGPCLFLRPALSAGDDWSSRERQELMRSKGRENTFPSVCSVLGVCCLEKLFPRAALELISSCKHPRGQARCSRTGRLSCQLQVAFCSGPHPSSVPITPQGTTSDLQTQQQGPRHPPPCQELHHFHHWPYCRAIKDPEYQPWGLSLNI